MDLSALVDFNFVAKHGGFSAAARSTRRPKATLSRRVAELEAQLGVRLFERGTRAPRLTEEGRALHERTSALLSDLDEVAAAVVAGSNRPRGRMRISAPLQFAQAAMGSIAAGFVVKYPEVDLEVTAEDRTANLVEDGYDLAIRVNPRPEPDLVGRCFLRDRLMVVASPDLPPPVVGDTVPAILLGAADATAPWTIRRRGGAWQVTPRPVLRLSSLTMMRDAARSGVGAASLPLSLVAGDIARGRLANWGAVEGPDIELWALHTSRRLPSSRVSAFMAHLATLFPMGAPAELAAFIAGD